MDINYSPDTCPKCGISIKEYLKGLVERFETDHAADLATIRSKAKYKGIVKGFIFGVFVTALALSFPFVARDQQQPLMVFLWSFFSDHPFFASMLYFAATALGVLRYGTGRDSREEQRMWKRFVDEQMHFNP